MDLFRNDPRFKGVLCWDPLAYPKPEQMDRLLERTKSVAAICKKQGWDHLNLLGAIEATCLIDYEKSPDLDLPRSAIAQKYNRDIYEHHFNIVDIAMPDGWFHEPSIYFLPHEEDAVKRWHEKTKEYFKVLVTVGGSSIQKVFPTWMPSFCKTLVDEFPFAVVYLLGDEESASGVWEYKRTVNYVRGCTDSRVGFKQSLLMQKYANYSIGSDTGMMIGAGMFGTPKTTLFNLAHKDQLVKHHRNDHSIQSQAWCSPCFTLAYSGMLCQKESRYGAFPICTDKFDLEELWGYIETEYERWLNGGSF